MDIKPPNHPAGNLSPDLSGAPLPPASTTPVDSPKKSSKTSQNWRSAASTILLIGSALGLAFLIAAFCLQSYQVDGQSMETALQNSDRLIVDKIPRTWARITHHAYVPNRGDIIIFNQAGLFDSSGKAEKQLIKRVIGLPGERVVVKNGSVTIYNQQHPEGFNPDKTVGYKITAPTTPGEVDLTLKSDEIFVCGDNRTNSEDSRYFGPVSVDHIVGKLVLRLIPLGNAQRF